MGNLICTQCGSGDFEKVAEDIFKCMYCNSVLQFKSDTSSVLNIDEVLLIDINDYEDPEFAELNRMELIGSRSLLKTEVDPERRSQISENIRMLYEELKKMKKKI